MVTTLDKYGRLIIPKKFRKHLGITETTNLNIREEDRRIIVEPFRNDDAIVSKDGVFVYTGEAHAAFEELLKSDRDKRLSRLLRRERD